MMAALTLAIPSKGRLKDNCNAWFASAGVIMEQTAGAAEVIVDITTSGTTLKDNGLKVRDDGVILKGQAQVRASLGADWSSDARAAASRLLAKLDPANPLFATLAAHLPG